MITTTKVLKGIRLTLQDAGKWSDFYHKKENGRHLSRKEQEQFSNYIGQAVYLDMAAQIAANTFPAELPSKIQIVKEHGGKKRTVYSFSEKINITLKFTASYLQKYDGHFCENCYAFRAGHGVGDAVRKIRSMPWLHDCYVYKTDIHNYFNSIDVER